MRDDVQKQFAEAVTSLAESADRLVTLLERIFTEVMEQLEKEQRRRGVN